MDEINILMYDDQFSLNDAITVIANSIRKIPGCSVVTRDGAVECIEELLKADYKPHIVILDIRSIHDRWNPAEVDEAFEQARSQGFDIDDVLDKSLLKMCNQEDWRKNKDYGIGLLALATAVNCPHRLMLTQHSSDGLLVNTLLTRGLAERVLPKNYEELIQYIREVVETVRRELAVPRHVPAFYEVEVIKALEDTLHLYPNNKMTVQIMDLRSPKRSQQVEITGVEAIMFNLLLDNAGFAVSTEQHLQAINHIRSSRNSEYKFDERQVAFRTLLRKYGIVKADKKLEGDEREDDSTCRELNNKYCPWQAGTLGKDVPDEHDDGYRCYSKTLLRQITDGKEESRTGFCPKKLFESYPFASNTHQPRENKDAIRTIINTKIRGQILKPLEGSTGETKFKQGFGGVGKRDAKTRKFSASESALIVTMGEGHAMTARRNPPLKADTDVT